MSFLFLTYFIKLFLFTISIKMTIQDLFKERDNKLNIKLYAISTFFISFLLFLFTLFFIFGGPLGSQPFLKNYSLSIFLISFTLFLFLEGIRIIYRKKILEIFSKIFTVLMILSFSFMISSEIILNKKWILILIASIVDIYFILRILAPKLFEK